MKKFIAVSLALQTLIVFYYLTLSFVDISYQDNKFNFIGSSFLVLYITSMVLFFINSKNNFDSKFLYNLLIISSFLSLLSFIIFTVSISGLIN